MPCGLMCEMSTGRNNGLISVAKETFGIRSPFTLCVANRPLIMQKHWLTDPRNSVLNRCHPFRRFFRPTSCSKCTLEVHCCDFGGGKAELDSARSRFSLRIPRSALGCPHLRLEAEQLTYDGPGSRFRFGKGSVA